MAQVYAVVHDNAGNFLMGRKYQRGYFFHHNCGTQGGGIILPGGQALNGGGRDALPGGRQELRAPEDAAALEFLEETNVSLFRQIMPTTVSVIPQPQNNPQYYAVYFEVQANQLQAIYATITTNLQDGLQAAQAVMQGQYQPAQYDALMTAHPQSPVDNELDTIRILNRQADAATINSWNAPAVRNITGWYTAIINNMP